MQPVHDNEVFAVFRADRLEYQTGEGNDLLLWDAQAWVGTDYNKLWFKSEGTWLIDQEEFEEAVIELFYSRNIASYWDAQIGIRHDFKPIPTGLSPHLAFKGLCRYGSKWRRPHMSARTVIFLRLWRPNIICSSAGG